MTPAPPSAHATAQGFSPRRRTLAFAIVALAFVMDLLDLTIVNVALPAIRQGLGAGAAALQWTVAGYALAFGVLLVSGGRLGDVHGYRRLFLAGVAGFTLASVLCGLALAPWQLVAARVLQGAASALMVPQVMALLQVMYAPDERLRVFGVFGLLGGLASALGPVAGGLLIEADPAGLGWRSVFLVNLPVGVFAFLAGLRLLPGGASTQAKALDGRGTLLATAALLAVLLPLVQGPESGWPAWCAVSLLVAVPLGLWTWRAWQSRQARDASALVDPALLARPGVRRGLAAGLALHGVVPAYLLPLTFAVQGGLGATPRQMGLLCLPIAVGAAVSILWASRRSRWPAQRLVVLGAGLQALAVVIAVLLVRRLLEAHAAPGLFDPWLLAAHALMGLGIGCIGPALTTATLRDVPTAEAGSSGGVVSAVQQLAVVAALALVGALMFGGSVQAQDAASLREGLARAAAGLLVLLALGAFAARRLGR